jgi:tetratricopeptide (TPR) repeat protein
MIGRRFLVGLFFLSFSAAALADSAKEVARPPVALSSGDEARGDYASFLKALAAEVESAPASFEARLALVRIAALRPLVPDSAAILRAPLERALAAIRGDPENRDRILAQLGAIHAEAGEWDRAALSLRERGVVRDWLVVGPFGRSRRGAHDRAFPVEAAQRAPALDIEEPFDGRGRKVRWRKATLGSLDPVLEPGERIWPASGAAYALAQVRAPAGSKALVSVACKGSFKVFWNGREVVDFDRSDAYLPREAQFEVTFGEGWQRLLVKDSTLGEGVGVRIVAADGSGPLPGLEVASGDRIEPLGGPPASVEPLSPLRFRGQDGGWALAGGAVLLDEAGLGPEALPLFEKAIAALPASPHVRFFYGAALERAWHLPETRRKNDARRQYARALELDPKFAPALEREARFFDEDGKPDEALRALRKLGADFPGFAGARLSAARICRRQGWDAEMVEEAQKLLEVAPRSTEGRLFLADYYERKGDASRALALYQEAAAIDCNLRIAVEKLASLLLRRGDAEAAEKIVRPIVERNPEDRALRRRLAEILRAKGDLAGAARVYRELSDLCGGDPDDLERAGDALLESGAREDALALFRRALEIAPGRYSRRRLVARLSGEEEEFWKEFDIDAGPMIENAPGLEKYPKASSICILDHTVSRIYRDGSQVDYVHQVFKLLDQDGVERYHTLKLPGEVLEIRTITKEGEVYEPIVTDNTEEILMPKLGPGATIEYRYRRVVENPPAFQFDSGSFFFKDPEFSEPFVLSRFVVIADKGFEFETIERNFPAKPEVEARGDRVVFTWELRDSDRIDEERFMPEKEEILPWVRLLERRDWEDVVEVYRDRTSGRTRLTPELRAKAAEVVSGAQGDAEKARRLFDFAFAYVKADARGNEASEVLATRTGSRVILLKALLDAALVPSRFALCGENPDLVPAPIWDPPRPELFSTEMLVIEPRDGDPVWIHDGGKYTPYGLVPTRLRGAPALLVSERGGEFRTVPAGGGEDAVVERRTRIRLEDRAARVAASTTFRDAAAYRLKEEVVKAQKAQLENFVESELAKTYIGAKLLAFDFPEIERPGVPFRVTAEASVASFVDEREGVASIRTGLQPLDLAEEFAGEGTREHPMLIRLSRSTRDEVEIDLGGAYEVDSVPQALLRREKWGAYSLTFDVAPGKIRIARAFTIAPSRIEPEEYPDFLRYVREIEGAEGKRIFLRRTAK